MATSFTHVPAISAQANKFGPGAEVRFTKFQVVAALITVGVTIGAGILFGVTLFGFLKLFVALSTTFFLVMLGFSIRIAFRGIQTDAMIKISDEELAAFDQNDLPTITIIMAAFDEAKVAQQLVKNLEALEYPLEKLQVLIALEEGDHGTIAAFRQYAPAWMTIVVRSKGNGLMTKPAALNYALGFVWRVSEITVIYDAEDKPAENQLLKAVLALKKARQENPQVVCVQARLSFDQNANKNLVTRLLALDYIQHFGLVLPGLSSLGLISPLGGTSNFILTKVLLELKYDPSNTTEDLNLAVFLSRHGLHTRVFDSVTAEEAVADVKSFVKQRSRWIKGGIQTWFRHMRNPLQLLQDLGLKRFVSFQCVIGAPLILYVINPFFWGMTLIYAVFHPPWIQALYSGPVFYAASGCFVFGNFAYLYFLQIAAFRTKNFGSIILALVAPLYWVILSVAGYKAYYEFFRSKKKASAWDKTTHKGSGK